MAEPAKIQVHRNASRMRQEAKKIGIKIPVPKPSLPETEQEQTDTM
jgi:hypothetical protein